MSGRGVVLCLFFFFNDTATTEIYTLSLHDALPIYGEIDFDLMEPTGVDRCMDQNDTRIDLPQPLLRGGTDRKSTRLNSSHSQISYAVFCLKKKKNRYHRSPDLLRHHG